MSTKHPLNLITNAAALAAILEPLLAGDIESVRVAATELLDEARDVGDSQLLLMEHFHRHGNAVVLVRTQPGAAEAEDIKRQLMALDPGTYEFNDGLEVAYFHPVESPTDVRDVETGVVADEPAAALHEEGSA